MKIAAQIGLVIVSIFLVPVALTAGRVPLVRNALIAANDRCDKIAAWSRA